MKIYQEMKDLRGQVSYWKARSLANTKEVVRLRAENDELNKSIKDNDLKASSTDTDFGLKMCMSGLIVGLIVGAVTGVLIL